MSPSLIPRFMTGTQWNATRDLPMRRTSILYRMLRKVVLAREGYEKITENDEDSFCKAIAGDQISCHHPRRVMQQQTNVTIRGRFHCRSCHHILHVVSRSREMMFDAAVVRIHFVHVSLSFLPTRNEPAQDGIEIGLFFRADAITANFSMCDGIQIKGLNDVVGTCVVWQIGFVAQNQEWDTFHGRLLQEEMQLFFCIRHGSLVGRVDDEAGWNNEWTSGHHRDSRLTRSR